MAPTVKPLKQASHCLIVKMIQFPSIHPVTKIVVVPSEFRLRELPDFTDLNLAADFLYPMVELLQFLMELLLLSFDFKPGFTPYAFSPVEGKAEKIELCFLGVVEVDDSGFLLIERKAILGHSLVQVFNKRLRLSFVLEQENRIIGIPNDNAVV